MEPSELVANAQENTEWPLRVLDLGQKLWRETEGQRDLGRLVEVRLENVAVEIMSEKPAASESTACPPVENQEALEDLELLLVMYRTTNVVVYVLVNERLRGLQALVRKRRPARVVRPVPTLAR